MEIQKPKDKSKHFVFHASAFSQHRPCAMFNNPLEHQWIRKENAVKIDANHLIVVYRQLPDNSVERRIVQGPTLFVPEAGEWWVQFVLMQKCK